MVARGELKRASFQETQKMEQTKKGKTSLTELPLDALCQQSKENIGVNDTSTSVEIQTLLTGDRLNNLHDSLQTREEEIQRLEKENKNIKEMNSKFQQEMKSLKHALDNNRFEIDQYKDKDDDITFYTGFPDYKTLILC